MIDIKFVRHAKTELNGKGYVATKKDFPLTQEGINECKNLQFQEDSFDMVYTSTYIRTIQTAQIIYPYKYPRITPLITQRDLGELNEHFKYEYDEEYLEKVRNYVINPKNAESLEDILERLRLFFRLVSSENVDNARVLVVSHNGIMRIIEKEFAKESDYLDSNNLSGFSLKLEKKNGKIK